MVPKVSAVGRDTGQVADALETAPSMSDPDGRTASEHLSPFVTLELLVDGLKQHTVLLVVPAYLNMLHKLIGLLAWVPLAAGQLV